MHRQTPWTSGEKWGKIKLLIQPQRLVQRARKGRRNRLILIASVAHLTRYFFPILFTENAGVLVHTDGFLFSFAIRDITHCWRLLPPPRATSTPATTGVDSSLRATTPCRFLEFKIRRRGDFPLPHLRRTKLTRLAGQVCRLFLSPQKSTCAAGVLITT